ncbi:hypothetical protein B0F88_109118 [Methylobacter tundripaludum]|uniref:Uncharacterized protein n=1 Tax=Methylobacter tundripaludum TaxID=173365 RepID=A0A2S6GXV6_9GAMM|nr:hypothetical protein B0F88_109118 [Methylobacter tundripaludum]
MLLEVIHTDIDKNILSQILQWLMILIPLSIQTINLHPYDSAVGAGRARDWATMRLGNYTALLLLHLAGMARSHNMS